MEQQQTTGLCKGLLLGGKDLGWWWGSFVQKVPLLEILVTRCAHRLWS